MKMNRPIQNVLCCRDETLKEGIGFEVAFRNVKFVKSLIYFRAIA